MQKLQWYTLQELTTLETVPLLKCIGKVKSIDRKTNYYSFILTDGNNQVQATIYQDQRSYSLLKLPNRNQSVIVVGHSYRRQLSSKSTIIKIHIKLFQIVSSQMQQKISNKILQAKKNRQNNQLNQNITTKNKISLLKQLKIAVQPVEIRSLILGCVYMTLQNNSDLSSYTFSIYTIQKHRLTKSYIQSKKLKQQSVEYLSQFIDTELRYLVQHQQIQQKQKLQNQRIYVVHRSLFTKIQMRILGIINQKQKTGTVLSDLVNILNRQQGFVEEKNYIINDNFVQKVLKKFIEQSRIYKTSEKVLYPNN